MIYLDIECTSLSADSGILTAIGLILPSGETKLLFVEDPEEEKEVIQEFIEILRDYKEEPLVIWYSDFDLPFLVTRAVKHGLDVSEIYDFRIIDLCKLIQKNLKFTSNKLDEVSKFFGFEKNLRLTGKDVQLLYISAIKGDIKSKKEILDHCYDDLLNLKKIFEKLEPYVQKWLRKDY